MKLRSLIVFFVVLIACLVSFGRASRVADHNYTTGDVIYYSSGALTGGYISKQAHISYDSQLQVKNVGGLLNDDIGPFLNRDERGVIDGNYFYVTSYIGDAVEVFDISDPTTPIYVSSLSAGQGGALLDGAYDIFKLGNYLYVTAYDGAGLEIIDASNPLNLTHVGKILNGAGGASLSNPVDIYVEGNYAYIASEASNAIEIVNISNPATPTHAGKLLNGSGGAALSAPRSVYKQGNYLYVASNSSNAMEIVNITDPSNPTHAGKLLNGSGGAAINNPLDVYVEGNYAYISAGNSNAVEIADISNPATPIHAGNIFNGSGGAILGRPHGLYKSGDYLYVVADNSNSLEILNVSNPANPTHVGSLLNGSGGAKIFDVEEISIKGNYAYLINIGGMALEVVDISNPTTPTHVNVVDQKVKTSRYMVDIKKNGNYVYTIASNYVDGAEKKVFSVFDASTPGRLIYKGSLTDGDDGAVLLGASRITVDGPYAYVAASTTGVLEIIDVSTPTTPTHAAKIIQGEGGAIIDKPNGVIKDGDYLYLTSRGSNNGLEIINVSDPTHPTHAGKLLNGSGGAALTGSQGLFKKGNYVYVAAYGDNALEIIDVSTPASPTHVGKLVHGTNGALLNKASSVYVTGDYAYVISYSNSTLEVVNISNPAVPTHVTSMTGSMFNLLARIDGAGNFLYITSYNTNTVEILNISNPENPVRYNTYYFNTADAKGAYGVSTDGEYSFIGTYGTLGMQTIRVFTGDNEPGTGVNRTNYWTEVLASTPTASVEYSPTAGAITDKDVVATLTGWNKSLTGMNATSHTFTENGTFVFTFSDLVGNTGQVSSTVDWIHKSSGGSSMLTKDSCPNGDLSSSFYDGLCTVSTHASPDQTNFGSTATGETNELLQAYTWAFDIGITTQPSFEKADMQGGLIRAHLAKMMSNYAIHVLGKSVDTGMICTFDDIQNESEEMQGYIKLACQLGLMGKNIHSFDPEGTVTRAQFGTVLSRTLWGDTHNDGTLYYTNHLQALKDVGIMNNILDPETTKELRGYVMLMLMRSNK